MGQTIIQSTMSFTYQVVDEMSKYLQFIPGNAPPVDNLSQFSLITCAEDSLLNVYMC